MGSRRWLRQISGRRIFRGNERNPENSSGHNPLPLVSKDSAATRLEPDADNLEKIEVSIWLFWLYLKFIIDKSIFDGHASSTYLLLQ